MSNIQNIDISLQEIVKNISENTYLIPKFQRDFVWKDGDIVDLGDSLIRGYPISSLLIMAENGSLNIGAHTLSKDDPPSDYEADSDSNEIRYYILDGQQRLTSISRLFLNFDSKKEYYFDLLAMLVEKFPEDNIKDDSGIRKNCLLSEMSDGFCRSFPIAKDGSEKPTRQHNRFISGKSIIDNKFGSVVSKFLKNFKDASEENIDKYTDYLNAVLGAVGGYSVPATVISRDSELGIVIRVFEKVNSTGKKLTLFDLINAKSFQVKHDAYKEGLTNYLNNSIAEAVLGNQSYKCGVDSFLSFDENNKTYQKLDKISRILEISSLLKSNHVPSIFKSTMLSKDPLFWFIEWDNNKNLIIEVISWMNEEGMIEIGQITFLEYAIAVILSNPKAFGFPKFKDEIKRYALYLSLSGTGFSKSNLDVVERFHSLSLQMITKHESEKYNYPSFSSSPNLRSDDVLEITPSSAKFTSILNIFYNEKVKGLFTVDIAGNKLKLSNLNAQDRHHIFPKARAANYTPKSIFNSIANYILLDSSYNRVSVKDKSPKEYLQDLKSFNPKIEQHCAHNLIDYKFLSNVHNQTQAEEFIKNRAQKIADMVNSYFE